MSKVFEQGYRKCGLSSSHSAFNMSDTDEHTSAQRKRRSGIEETAHFSIKKALSLFISRLIYTLHNKKTYIRQDLKDRFTELRKNFVLRKLEESTNFKFILGVKLNLSLATGESMS